MSKKKHKTKLCWIDVMTTEDSKTGNKKKAVFKENTKSYLNYRFITTDDSHAASPLYIICSDRLSNEAMTPSKLHHHIESKH